MILVAVGTFIRGFDALVDAADGAALRLGLAGFAQIGHSIVEPRHLAWKRFLPPAGLRARIAAADLVVCHGGMGLVGEAMRAGKPIIIVPRRGSPTRASPAGDQTALARRLAALQPVRVCEEPDRLEAALQAALAPDAGRPDYALGSDVPELIAGFLRRSAG